jgi:alpha-beta hydrolase superfamily lysophospholipase
LNRAAFERYAVSLPGDTIALALHLPAGTAAVPCVLACHGLSASKESDKYLQLGEEFPRAGLALARFDFRGCGESTGVERDTTVATRIDDALAVIDRLAKHARLDGRIGLLGSSMGGFVALHVARVLGGTTPVVTWNAPAHFIEGPEWPPDPHSLEAPRQRRDAPRPSGLGPAFFAEVERGAYASTPAGVPRHLVVQGECDDVVAPGHGATLHARAGEPKALLMIPGADHRLTDMAHRRRAVDESLAWLRRFLS